MSKQPQKVKVCVLLRAFYQTTITGDASLPLKSGVQLHRPPRKKIKDSASAPRRRRRPTKPTIAAE